MKVILSRKGFDSSNGGYPSPILPDGTMLSLPIPDDIGLGYSEIQYNGVTYSEIISQLTNGKFKKEICHLDPDIRPDLRTTPAENWSPAFGQVHSAQGVLRNAKVEIGDIFLYFGWFRKTIERENGYNYLTRKDSDDFYDISDLHAIYGYMQIGEIITDKEEIKKYSWHPHSFSHYNEDNSNNALYLPAKRLSFAPNLPGYGTFAYDKKYVLTAENKTRSNWVYKPFYAPENVCGTRKNCAKETDKYIQYNGIWQELVLDESPELINWIYSLFE